MTAQARSRAVAHRDSPDDPITAVAPATASVSPRRRLLAPLLWGVVFGVVQAASPLAFPWLDTATVYALGLTLIAAVYVGFAVADGRRHVLVVETVVASVFVVAAACAELGSAWLIVAGLAGHGLKDLWQHRTGFVAGTRWWPPFCATVDWVAAALIAVALAANLLPA